MNAFGGKLMIFVLTGPSGAGKTTYAKMLLEHYKDIAIPSHTITTRKQREGKDESKQYTFISKDDFLKSIDGKEFACWTEFCGNFYGIKKSFIDEIKKSGKLLIIDSIQNPQQVRKMHPNTVVVYLSASDEEMEKRISERPNATKSDIETRKADYARWKGLKKFCTHSVDTGSQFSEFEVFNELKKTLETTMLPSAKSK